MSVLLPALGMPTRATSARSLSSRPSQRSSPTSPCSAKAGARRRLERKRALPRPPRPPPAASQRSPASARSARRAPSGPRTTVPTGTGTSRAAPRAPWRRLPCPWRPSPARRWGWSRKPSSDAWLVEATSHTSPPSPPSPPSGPPRDTCASRRNDTAPAPPSPAFTWTCASSTNPGMRPILRCEPAVPEAGTAGPGDAAPGVPAAPGSGLGDGTLTTRRPLRVPIAHHAGGGGEEGVVAAPADVVTGVELGAALAEDDRPGGDGRAVVDLDAQALRVRVAAVAGRARRPWSWT